MADCPFCDPVPLLGNELAVALWDNYPVSPGHALVVPRRHVPDWWSATAAERAAMGELLLAVRGLVDARHHPAGYTLGVNIGEAAGQTVFHLHMHLIPRYPGDVPDPTGGVRNVIPGRGRYPA